MDMSQCMKRNVVSIEAQATIAEAAALIVKHHIGLLPVVNSDGRLIGVLGLRDLLSLSMPVFVKLLDDLDFVYDFGAVEDALPDPIALAKPVTSLMRAAISVKASSGLLRAYSLLEHHHIHDLPVVDDAGRLVGIASRVDIGAAILGRWQPEE